jgi:hypothetical protein
MHTNVEPDVYENDSYRWEQQHYLLIALRSLSSVSYIGKTNSQWLN